YKIIDIQTVIEETWDSIQGNLPTQNISFHSDIAPIKNFCTKEVPFRIALYNILENAVLYACELSPEVKILAKKQGDRIYVEILDNGVGIPAELTERIFDMFIDRKSTRLNSSHVKISYAVFCLEKKSETAAESP